MGGQNAQQNSIGSNSVGSLSRQDLGRVGQFSLLTFLWE